MAELNDREKRFCDEYLGPCKFNGTQAAINAGYAKNSARVTASKLLTKANIQEYLQSRTQKIANKLEISQERTMREIARIAFADPRMFFHPDGTLKDISELDDDAAAILASIEVDELTAGKKKIGSTKKVKFWNKTDALEFLAKHFKIFDDGAKVINNIDLSAFSTNDLNTLLALKQKGSK